MATRLTEPEGISLQLTPREQAAILGLDYDALPEELTIREAQEKLDLPYRTGIHQAIVDGRIPEEGVRFLIIGRLPSGEPRKYWYIQKDYLLDWAINRRTGRQPSGSIPHFKSDQEVLDRLRMLQRRKGTRSRRAVPTLS